MAEVVVIRRQLLPPKPSSKAIVAFFGPHHDGVSAKAAELPRVKITAAAASAICFLGNNDFMFFLLV